MRRYDFRLEFPDGTYQDTVVTASDLELARSKCEAAWKGIVSSCIWRGHTCFVNSDEKHLRRWLLST